MKAKPNAAANFQELERVITGQAQPSRVHLVELGVDQEMERYVTEEIFGNKWVDDTEETRRAFARQHVDFYARMGYDFAPGGSGFRNMPQFKDRRAADTAGLSRGQRRWVEEGGGIIKNRDDFERIDWEGIRGDFRRLEEMRAVLPEGMKLVVIASVFEMILERFLGYQDLFMLSVDDPELVEAVFERWGQKVYDYYSQALEYPEVGAIFHADDLGFKTATMMSPEFLRRNVFPWFTKYAALAHERGRTYWYHCCGNVAGVMADLIQDVGIDAFHSFQDVIVPIGDFLDRHGPDIAALGGVDVDNLGRMEEPDLRVYVRKILDECMPRRFALGSGNTVANYIPVRNYLAMVDEARCWSG
ncbi:MAG: uroporphyrinogen decarboxylase family protein [Phycisphaerae bacterium]|jgi:uroporphyrinogen decarboxylase|nr:uroporphyrinogen decarboxylase family protein [Phycisphaerae bacterium]